MIFFRIRPIYCIFHLYPKPRRTAKHDTMSKYDPKLEYNRTLAGMGTTELIIGILMAIFGIFTVAAHDAAVDHYIKATIRSKTFDHYANPDLPPFDPATITVGFSFTYTSQGIWCGAAMIATGIFGLLVKGKPTKAIYTVNMILSVTTVHLAIASTVLSGIAVDRGFFNVALIVAHAFIGLLSAVSIAVTVTHAVYCYPGTFWSESTSTTYNSQTETTNFRSGTYA